jgi:photosystem II stability/assembly factor-like uncharacterized protein
MAMRAAISAIALILLSACPSGSSHRSAVSSPSPPANATAQATASEMSQVFVRAASVTFLDRARGWSLVSLCGDSCHSHVVATTDGGAHWTDVSALSVPDEYASGIAFGTRHDGWIFGEALLVTHDGGRRWSRLRFADERRITSLSAVGSTVWAILERCVDVSSDQACDTLMASDDGGRTWRNSAAHIVGTSGAIVRLDRDRAWISSFATGANPWRLIETSDGGRTWRARKAPCSSSDLSSVFAAEAPDDLWVVCGSEPGAGNQIKVSYRSRDGGVSWARASKELPEGGYVSRLVVADGVGWLALQRSAPLVSRDGGRSWRTAGIRTDDDFSGFGGFDFVDPSHGWIPNYGMIFRTTDGGHTWTSVSLATTFPGTNPGL